MRRQWVVNLIISPLNSGSRGPSLCLISPVNIIGSQKIIKLEKTEKFLLVAWEGQLSQCSQLNALYYRNKVKIWHDCWLVCMTRCHIFFLSLLAIYNFSCLSHRRHRANCWQWLGVYAAMWTNDSCRGFDLQTSRKRSDFLEFSWNHNYIW